MKKHFVKFFFPGMIVAEGTTKPIESWDVDKAVEMSKDIKEPYNALPYGFCFVTRERQDNELDSREVARSGVYFLGGEVFTIEDIEQRNDPGDKILLSNMKSDGWDRIVVNTNSYKLRKALRENDHVLAV